MSLELTQRRFWDFIRAPEGVTAAKKDIALTDPEGAQLTSWISAKDEDEATLRLDIYANMYFFRLLEILRDDFPALVAVMGDDRFHNLVTDYVWRHPPDNPSVQHIGARLPSFIEERQLEDTPPYLSELARFELIRDNMIVAGDSSLLASEELASLAPEDWINLVLEPIQALKVQSFAYPVNLVWEAIHKEEDIPSIEKQETTIAFWRREFRVFHDEITKDEAFAVEQIKKDISFSELCELCQENNPDSTDDIAQVILSYLVNWVSHGWLASFRIEEAPLEG